MRNGRACPRESSMGWTSRRQDRKNLTTIMASEGDANEVFTMSLERVDKVIKIKYGLKRSFGKGSGSSLAMRFRQGPPRGSFIHSFHKHSSHVFLSHILVPTVPSTVYSMICYLSEIAAPSIQNRRSERRVQLRRVYITLSSLPSRCLRHSILMHDSSTI
jgi:hypothetical protein